MRHTVPKIVVYPCLVDDPGDSSTDNRPRSTNRPRKWDVWGGGVRRGAGWAYLRDSGIATVKLPERLEVRDELPRYTLGKILKRELRGGLRGAQP